MRTLLRLAAVIVVVIVAVVLLQDAWDGAPWRREAGPASDSVGTSGIDTGRARQVGAEIGEKAALATQEMKETAQEAAITTKIKAKMALDELVKARAIDVSTDGTTVTLRGSVTSAAERDRAVSLARETDGVAEVFDQMVIR
jgi:osmotically-inducible protein OsmY